MSALVKKIMIIVGTRPEMIKLAPIILHLQKQPRRNIEPIIVFTGQHEGLVQKMSDVFGIRPDVHLHEMRAHDDLTHLTSRLLSDIGALLTRTRPDMVMVQGDTTSVLSAALAAFYQGIPIAHVEAGLRTGDMLRPFPEEANRSIVARLAAIHFAPTAHARNNLIAEGIAPEKIVITGNSVIDAVELMRETHKHAALPEALLPLTDDKRLLLMTMHRREAWEHGIANVAHAIRAIVRAHEEVCIALPVHPGPTVHDRIHKELGGVERVHLLPPLDYPSFLALAARAYLLLTDSGGLQEEAAALNKPVLILREVTERMEAVDAGIAKLVGTDTEKIVAAVDRLLASPSVYGKMSGGPDPFGDGSAAHRIATSLVAWFQNGNPQLPKGAEFTGAQDAPEQAGRLIA